MKKLIIGFVLILLCIGLVSCIDVTEGNEQAQTEMSTDGILFQLSEDGNYYEVVGTKNKEASEIVIPTTFKDIPVKKICQYAFQNSKATSITISPNITFIENSAFSGCESLTKVCITDIAKWCEIEFKGFDANPLFYAENLYVDGVEVWALSIPDETTKIGEYAFCNFKDLTAIDIPDSVTSIGKFAFYYCQKLNDVRLGEGIRVIGDNAFEGCSELTYMDIPDSVQEYGYGLFMSCEKIKRLTLPYVRGSSNMFHHAMGELFGVVSNLYIPETLKTVVITGGEVICPDAFSSCENITSISLPETLTEIGSQAFMGCINLERITIPENVVRIDNAAFSNCNKLTQIIIPDSVTYLGEGIFENCENLRTVEIGDGVTNIDKVFTGEDGIKSVTLGMGVTAIGDYVFYHSELESITFSAYVSSIGAQAFEHSRLTTINYGGTIEQWEIIDVKTNWNYTPEFRVYCLNGTLKKSQIIS